MTKEQRSLLQKHPEFKELFIMVSAMYYTMYEIPSFQKSFQVYSRMVEKDFDIEIQKPDAEI